mgnify:CR=1 FL=1
MSKIRNMRGGGNNLRLITPGLKSGACSAGVVIMTALLTSFHFLNLAQAQNTYLVPDNFPTIQSAIDAAVNGDTIIVRDGTYTGTGNKEIDLKGHAAKAGDRRRASPFLPRTQERIVVYCVPGINAKIR